MDKQVEKKHYDFSKYVTKERWCSIWHQLDEVLGLEPESVLEVGPGPGLFKAVAGGFGLKVDTLDIAEDLNPDIIASAVDMPLSDKSYDVVCSFQMLEHIPFDMSKNALKEMARVSRNHIVISLPDAEIQWPYSLYVPKRGTKKLLLKRPFSKIKEHEFDGEHYWEINKKGYELQVIQGEIENSLEGFKLKKTYRVPENPYHRFFVFERI
ncbi:class I SAM-dependent methyltransferase [Gynuella sunshinyii]|uniref:2-polyprenyl-3-methyl-5-hydroxy-6-metoxy-1, 4-benzoquinol methylase n=1 Tax=Gynuella sunshinyii YC6258 TaxID=1445510 RepID=A0A0C5V7S1_9GAMM|nr:class I SAM-dependent methyltransferase [Gynuella sunshinyii]AJQ95470.1 2-polyprenyl-3-methyl-5-hydroxy-6-metoxy-1,4-benzoquinol methylase [Gynuella sunshinyii YC6258]